MFKGCFLGKGVFFFSIVCATCVNAASITWVGRHPDADMNNPDNWSPEVIPGNTDEANFDSSIVHIETHLTDDTSFSVDTFHFPHRASGFVFNFNNATLTFNGVGITGAQTNCTINVSNIDNSAFPGNQLSFLGSAASSGSAHMTVSNSATLTGSQSNTSIGSIASNFYSSAPFIISDCGEIHASNTGLDSTQGTGNNGTANTGSSQLRFDQSFTAENHVVIAVSNEATFSGTNTTQGDAVAIVNGSQFAVAGVFVAGDEFSCTVENGGNDSSLGVGLSNIGQLNAAQVLLADSVTLGDHCTITLSNTGSNSSQTTSFPDFVGYLNDEQLFVGGLFQAGDDFSLSVSNIGTDTSTGHGASQVAAINSNSGTSGNQVLFNEGMVLGERAALSIDHQGTYSGSNTNGGSTVGIMNLGQIAIGDSNAIGSYFLSAGDEFSLTASCSGNDSSNGLGSNVVGDVSTNQVAIYAPCSLGNEAEITISKSGTFSGHTTTSYVNVGSAGGSQLVCASSFQALDNFVLNISNTATHSGSGIGSDFIGDVITGQQAAFYYGLTLGDSAEIAISNGGVNTSQTSNGNQIGSLMGYGKQLWVNDSFQAGDDLSLAITNFGFDESTGAGGSYVGFINNNTVDQTASQLHLGASGTVGERANITLVNAGLYEGSNTTGAFVGVLAGHQFRTVNNFQAGDDFSLFALNLGINYASGHNSNAVGQVGNGGQVAIGGTCTLGNDAAITLINGGLNFDATGTSNVVGYVNGAQMHVEGNFTAGENCNISASNLAINTGDISNSVGYVNGAQLFFEQDCTFDDGSIISALNSGTVAGAQIIFNQGFSVTSGRAIIEALNEGLLGTFGVEIQGNSTGGNAEIVLQNNTLHIDTTLPTFMIGGLSGNVDSFVESQPILVIYTEDGVNTEFAGVIQDFPSTVSAVMKTGTGTQKFSGDNTYTGLTTVEEGTLIVSGSLAGDVLVDPLGTFKGSALVGGSFRNKGIVAPGESIGTLSVLGNYVNSSSGTYAVEVNGEGESDLIFASGLAVLNGGTVEVSSVDGTFSFEQPYVIVVAEGGVGGEYDEAISSAFITPTLTYDANHVYLTIQSALIEAAQSCNQWGVAENLDALDPDAFQSLLIGAIANLPLDEAQEALESLSGFQYTQNVGLTELSTNRFLRRLYTPLRPLVASCAMPCKSWVPWLETGFGRANLHGKHAHRAHTGSWELTGGIQRKFGHCFTLGFAGSYEYEHVHYKNGRGERHTEFLAAYGLYRPNQFYGLFDLLWGHSFNRLKRTIRAGDVQFKAHGYPDVYTSMFYGEVGFDVQKEICLIQPFFGIQAGQNWRKRVRESFAQGWGLSIHKHNWTSVSARLGLHLFSGDFFNDIDTSLDIAWNQRLSSHKNKTRSRFREFGESFSVCGNRLDECSFDYALSFAQCLCESFKGSLQLSGQWAEHGSTLDIVGSVELSW